MLFQTHKETKGVIDLGTPEQMVKLFSARELVSAPAQVSLAPTSPDRWKIYPRRDQDGSDSCVKQAIAKAAGILQEMSTGEFIEYSAAGYNKRSNRNYPSPQDRGMYPIEGMEIWRNDGISLEILEPSQKLSREKLALTKETQFSKAVGSVSKLGGYFALPAYSFDMVVSTLHATKKPIPLGFFGTYKEWSRDIPTLLNPSLTRDQAEVGHEVCATPNFGIFQGEEGFTIEDSWGSAGIGGTGVRWITRSFFERRNYIPGLVPTSFKNFEEMGIDPAKPRVNITKLLKYGMTDPQVRDLQRVYKYEGLFPANHSGSDYFGEITMRCTKEFQQKHDIVHEGTPETTGFGLVGPKTREVINRIYK